MYKCLSTIFFILCTCFILMGREYTFSFRRQKTFKRMYTRLFKTLVSVFFIDVIDRVDRLLTIDINYTTYSSKIYFPLTDACNCNLFPASLNVTKHNTIEFYKF